LDLTFSSRRLERLCNQRAAMTTRWGPPCAAVVAQSLQELDGLEQLGDLSALPHLRIRQEADGRVVVLGSNGVRITLELTLADTRSLDSSRWQEATSIVVADISVVPASTRRVSQKEEGHG
jgi:hypothetical protein